MSLGERKIAGARPAWRRIVAKQKSIVDYLPEPEGEKVMFQARVSKDLLKRVSAERTKHGVSWQDLIEAAFKKYLDDRGAK